MDDILEPIGTFLGYAGKILLLMVIAVVYLPAFLITTALTTPFEKMLEEFSL
jgi:hypothetical protein